MAHVKDVHTWIRKRFEPVEAPGGTEESRDILPGKDIWNTSVRTLGASSLETFKTRCQSLGVMLE